jgi:hypothetical protein
VKKWRAFIWENRYAVMLILGLLIAAAMIQYFYHKRIEKLDQKLHRFEKSMINHAGQAFYSVSADNLDPSDNFRFHHHPYSSIFKKSKQYDKAISCPEKL